MPLLLLGGVGATTTPSAPYFPFFKIAAEASYGVVPVNFPSGSPWYVGGRWQLAIPEKGSEYRDGQEMIFPRSGVDERIRNRVNPVIGRRWSEGTLTFPFTIELAELLFAGLWGPPDTQALVGAGSLLVNEPINESPKSLVLTAQPGTGRVLRFELKGTGNPGTIGVSGIDAYGNPASETISFSSGGLFNSRNVYQAIGASSLAVSGILNGSLTVLGIRRTHFTSGIGLPTTLTIEQAGLPDVGSNSSSFYYTGVVVKELRLRNDAEAPDGLLKIEADMEGRFSVTCPVSNPQDNASMHLVWPAWSMQARRDDADWNKVANADLRFMSENRNYRPAADSQAPQEILAGAIAVEGDLEVIVDNDDERLRWLGGSSTKLEFNWSAPWKTTNTTQQTMIITLASARHETYTLGIEDNGQYRLQSHIRAVINTASGGADDLLLTVTTPLPTTALGLTGI